MEVVPNPAASLILLKGDKENPLVLMGRRKASLRFMPGYYVFPGGRIDASDYDDAALLKSIPIAGIEGVRETLSTIDARAHTLGAIRELWEETGLLLGAESHSALQGASEFIQACNNKFMLPDVENCQCIAQAITPAGSPVRFNTFFFLADGKSVIKDSVPSGELEDIGWHYVKDALKTLQIADVTEAVLKESTSHWKRPKTAKKLDMRPPLMTYPRYGLEIQR